jgi:hypothetical protein
MIRKPTSGDSEQREHESERARKSSELSAGGSPRRGDSTPTHGSSEGESAHGALPRHGIEDEQGD